MTGSQTCFLALLLATGAMRLAESVVSWRRLRGRSAVPEPVLFPAMVLLHSAFIALPMAEVLLLERAMVPAIAVTAAVVLVLATGLRVWTLGTLRHAWNVRVVAPTAGAVVVDGPYRFVRHPNYLVVILEIAALPLVHTAWLSAIGLSIFNGFVLFFRIRNEERMLRTIPTWRTAFADRARLIPFVL